VAEVGNGPQEASESNSGIGMVRTVVNASEYNDRYAVKLLKYIPAEVLAAFVPLVALADKLRSGSKSGSTNLWVWVTIGVGAACVVGYNRWHATDMLRRQLESVHGPYGPKPWPKDRINREHKKLQPHAYFYLLAVVAFGAWALAVASPVRDVAGLNATQSEYIVAAVTFVLPLADVTMAHSWMWAPEEKHRVASYRARRGNRKPGYGQKPVHH